MTNPTATSSMTGMYGVPNVNVTIVLAVGLTVDVGEIATTSRAGSRAMPAPEFVGAPAPAPGQTSRIADTVSLPRSTPSGKTRTVPDASAAWLLNVCQLRGM